MYRLKLLQYLDRLSTYEAILGGVHIAHEEYRHTFFERFRELNIIQAAVEYARVCFSIVYTAPIISLIIIKICIVLKFYKTS